MKAFRYIIDANDEGIISIDIPDGKNKKFEVIILSLPDELSEYDLYSEQFSCTRMKLQLETGFVKNIIGSKEDDVWNEII